MKIMSTREEWLMNMILENINIQKRSQEGYFINLFLTGIPKDEFDPDTVLSLSGKIQNIASEIIDSIVKEKGDIDIYSDYDNILSQIKDEVRNRIKNDTK